MRELEGEVGGMCNGGWVGCGEEGMRNWRGRGTLVEVW